MGIVTFADGAVPESFRIQVQRLRDAAWPGEPADQRETAMLHDPSLAATILLLVDGERVLATLAVLHKQLSHRGAKFSAGGLSAVTTDPALRHHGYGHRIVSAARHRMRASGLDLALFTCDQELRSFYERAGWTRLPGVVIVGGTPSEPLRSDQTGFAKVAMGDFFSAHGRACRELFVDCDVELYPGGIDRLW